MRDELPMNTPVPTIDGSRFSPKTSPSDPIVTKLVAPVSTPASRVVLSRFASALPEESMVIDDRSNLSPAQVVESKLMNRLRESSMPVSHLQMRGLVRARFEF